jgi:hypothetical protein
MLCVLQAFGVVAVPQSSKYLNSDEQCMRSHGILIAT